MSTSTIVIGSQPDETLVIDQTYEQSIRSLAAREGLRLAKSRRLSDRTCGPTLYWLFDVSTRKLLSSKSGWTLGHVEEHLTVHH